MSESFLGKKLRSFNIVKKFRYSFTRSFDKSRHEHPDYHVPDNVVLNNTSPHNHESEVLLSSIQELSNDLSHPVDLVSGGTLLPASLSQRSNVNIEFGPDSTEVAVDVPDDFVPIIKSPPTSPRCASGVDAARFIFEHPLSCTGSDARQRTHEVARGIAPPINSPPTSPRYNTTFNFNFERALTFKNSVVGHDALAYEKMKFRNDSGPESNGAVVDTPLSPPTSQSYGPRLTSASRFFKNSGRKVKFLPTLDQVQAAASLLESESSKETLGTRKEIMAELKSEVLERVKLEANLIFGNPINSVDELKENLEIKKILAKLNKSTILLDYRNKSTKFKLQEIVAECVNSLKLSDNYNEAAERLQLQNNQSHNSSFNGELSNHLLALAQEWSNADSRNSEVSIKSSVAPKKTKSKLKKSGEGHFFRRRVMTDQMVEVTINKSYDPLGLTVYNEGRFVKIGRVISGGIAAKSKYFHEGDEIMAINDVYVRNKTIQQVESMLETKTGKVVILISPASPQPTRRRSSRKTLSLKAQFNYDPTEDIDIPCHDLGIGFQKGDILHVIDQKDPNWWQAYRDDEHDQPLAGIIPSREFQTMRQKFLLSMNHADYFRAATKRLKKKRDPNQAPEEMSVYEDVTLYSPKPRFTRPFIIIGPFNLYQAEFQQLLKKSSLFSFGISHTTRPKDENEVDGETYYFVSVHQFKKMISANQFIRYLKFGQYYYGLSFDSMRRITKSGKTGILYFLDPFFLKTLRDNGLMPYVIFFQSPTLERLQHMKLELKNKANENIVLEKIVKNSKEIGDKYGHYIDLTIVYSSAAEVFHEVVQKIYYLQSHPQWVPETWVRDEHFNM